MPICNLTAKLNWIDNQTKYIKNYLKNTDQLLYLFF